MIYDAKLFKDGIWGQSTKMEIPKLLDGLFHGKSHETWRFGSNSLVGNLRMKRMKHAAISCNDANKDLSRHRQPRTDIGVRTVQDMHSLTNLFAHTLFQTRKVESNHNRS